MLVPGMVWRCHKPAVKSSFAVPVIELDHKLIFSLLILPLLLWQGMEVSEVLADRSDCR